MVYPIPGSVDVNIGIVYGERQTSRVESNNIIVVTKDFAKEFTKYFDECYARATWSSGVEEDWSAIIWVGAGHIGRDFEKSYSSLFSFRL